MITRVRGNDYTALDVPALGEWTPELTVSVVVPAYNGQRKLDLTERQQQDLVEYLKSL